MRVFKMEELWQVASNGCDGRAPTQHIAYFEKEIDAKRLAATNMDFHVHRVSAPDVRVFSSIDEYEEYMEESELRTAYEKLTPRERELLKVKAPPGMVSEDGAAERVEIQTIATQFSSGERYFLTVLDSKGRSLLLVFSDRAFKDLKSYLKACP